MKEITVWYVAGECESPGDWPTLFDEKMGAEKWARFLFPNEPEHKRYQRIYSREVLTLAQISAHLSTTKEQA